MLGFQTEAIAELVGFAAFAEKFSIEEISAIKLQARFRGVHFEHAAGSGFMHRRGESEGAGLIVQNPVVVIAATELDLFVPGIHALANLVRAGEIEGSVRHRAELSRRDQSDSDRREFRCLESHLMVEYVAIAFSLEIEVAVLREVHRRGPVGSGDIVDAPFVFIGEQIRDADIECAGVTLLAVLAGVAEFHALEAVLDQGLAAPNHLIKSFQATVKRALDATWFVVGGELVFLAIELELPVRDAIAIAPDDGAEVGRVLDVFRQGVVAENDIRRFAFFVRCFEAENNGTVCHRSELDAILVGESKYLDFFAIRCFAKRFGFRHFSAHGKSAQGECDQCGLVFHEWFWVIVINMMNSASFFHDLVLSYDRFQEKMISQPNFHHP